MVDDDASLETRLSVSVVVLMAAQLSFNTSLVPSFCSLMQSSVSVDAPTLQHMTCSL